MSALFPIVRFVDDGSRDVTNDAGIKSYTTIDEDCRCKTHPTNFLSNEGVKTEAECAQRCYGTTNCKTSLHSPT